MIGSPLGPYKIIERLGAGGMGEVYLGEDTRLGRKVAIKVLPAEFASDPERLARFEQEARAAAALNHPHIAAVFDVGVEVGERSAAPTHYMVQEYLEGQSLSERLEKGALPVEEALDLAIEVGEALIAAHTGAIVHRDLKPDNIFVTTQGHAKVLDFGLAKLMEMAAPVGGQASISPTMLGTVVGQVMGTAGYMAPEQVNGEEVDQRADLFAFGAVLYEMVTGRRAFAGESVVQTLSKIAHDEPEPVSAVVATSPAELQRIIRKCLAKAPGRRYQHTDEVIIDLVQLREDMATGTSVPAVEGPSVAVATTVQAGRGVPWRFAVPIAATLLVGGILGTWLAMRPQRQSPVRLDLTIEDDIVTTLGSGFALSPDGTHIAYALGSMTAERELMIRSLDQQDSISLTARGSGPAAPYQPFFAPDGQWVGFVTTSELKKVPATGGTPLPIATVNRSRGADWGPDDTIVFAPNRTSGLSLVSANGGDPETLTELTGGELTHRWPQFLPGDKAVLFTSHVAVSNFDAATIEVVDLATRERKVVHRGGTYGRYVPTGHLVYMNGATLFALPFDLDAMEATGSANPVVENVTGNADGGGQFAFSASGMLAYWHGSAATSGARLSLSWMDREGNLEPLSFAPQPYSRPRLSPEADRIAVEIEEGGEQQVWILDIGTGTSQRLTFEGRNAFPLWSPDGRWVYFASDRGGDYDIFRKRADMSGEAEVVYEADSVQNPTSIFSDGSRLMFFELRGNPDIGVISLDGDPEPRMLIQTEAATYYPSISPDGRWFVFTSNETGGNQIHVQEIETGSRRVVSTAGGNDPVWSRNGSEIFYQEARGRWAVVQVSREPEISFSAPRPLFQVDGVGNEYDVTADGQRFLVLTDSGGVPADTAAEAATPRIRVVLNWFDELRERLPTGR